MINLVRGLALDYAAENIRVNAIAPGGASVGLNAGAAAHPVLGPAILERIPQHRWSQAREQAEAIWFLTSPAASYHHRRHPSGRRRALGQQRHPVPR